MTRAIEIEILMDNGSTKSEAENHLKKGTVVFDDFEENFDKYMEDGNDKRKKPHFKCGFFIIYPDYQ